METKRIRAGIVGVGKIGKAQIEAVQKLGYAEVAAIVVRQADRARELCEAYGIPTFYTDYRAMLANPDIDVVHDCTPNPAHFLINKDCILAGKHILSEKPLAIDSRESAELVALAKARNVLTSVNFVYRHYPIAQYVRTMIAGGALGDIYSINGSYFQDWLLHDTDYDWRVEAKLGGPSRAMADIGSHWCDMAQFLIGQDIAEVCADLATFIPVRMDCPGGHFPGRRVEVDTEDYGSSLLRFSGGARGAFTVSQVSPGKRLGLSFQIDGSKASVYWNKDDGDKLWIGHRDEPNEELDLNRLGRGATAEAWPDAQTNMIDSFYRTILYGDAPRHASFEEGHKIVKVVEAVVESAKSGKWIKISTL